MLTRVISALVGAPFLIALALWTGGSTPFPGWPLALLVLVLSLTALHELYSGCRKAGLTPRDGFGFAAACLFLWGATRLPTHGIVSAQFGFTVLIGLSLITETLRKDRAPLKSLAPTWLGAVYVGWLFPYVLRLRLLTPAELVNLGWAGPTDWRAAAGAGAWLLLFAALGTVAEDSFAYFTGKALGKHKLAPDLSPGKTWEGAVGGFLGCMLVGALLGHWLGLPLDFCLVASALIGVLGPLGDLTKSAIKREIGVKDFGTLIPGHGGVLDRFDSLLFTAPTVYWLALHWRHWG